MKARDIFAFAIGPVATAVLGFATLPMLTWLYSAEDIGRLAMLNVLSSFCALLFSLGLNQSFVREYHEVDDTAALFKVCLFPGLFIITLALSVTLLFPGLLSRLLFSIDSVAMSWLIASCVWFSFVGIFLSAILRMQERGMLFSIGQVLPRAILPLLIGLYSLIKLEFDTLHLILAQSLAIFLGTIAFGWFSRKDWIQAMSFSIDYDLLKRVLSFGFPLILGGLAFWGLTAMDKVFLRNYSSYNELGIYSVSVSFAGAAIIFQSIFSTIWSPLVYRWVNEGVEPGEIHKVSQHVLSCVLALFSIFGMFSWVVTWILPAHYARVQFILVACMGYPLFYTLSETTVVGIGIARKSIYSMLSSVIAVVVNLIGNYLFVPKLGAAGAAIATAIAFWVFLLCRTEFASKVWCPQPRVSLYFLTFICLLLSIVSAVHQQKYFIELIVAWILLFSINLVLNLKNILAFKRYIKIVKCENRLTKI